MSCAVGNCASDDGKPIWSTTQLIFLLEKYIMAKFINNSVISTIARRAYAEGMSMETVIAAIRKVSDVHAHTAGLYGANGSMLTNHGMANEVSEVASYHGGYMYVGGFILTSDGTKFDHRHHSVRDYDRRSVEDFYDNNLAKVRDMKDGSTITIGNECNDTSWNVYTRTINTCPHTESYDSAERYNALASVKTVGYVLYSGIRGDVARECEYDLNDGFHWVFDQAIEAMNNAS